MSNWVALGPLPGSNVSHTAPINDAVEHDVTDDCSCICGPRLEHIERTDGSDGWLYIHHSLDGRERSE